MYSIVILVITYYYSSVVTYTLLQQTNTSQCRMVNVTAAEAETTLENISVLLGNSSLNCFSAELNRSIIPMIANLVSSKVTVYAREDIRNRTIFI